MTQKKKTLILLRGLRRKNANFRGFRVFDVALYPKLKTRKSRKVFFYLNIW